MRINNKGIGAVVVLICILVVAAVVFTGYYVWNNQKEAEPAASQEIKTENPSSQEKVATNASIIALKDFDGASERLTAFAKEQTGNTKCLSMQLIKEYEDFAIINQGVADVDINGNTPADGSCGGYGGGARHYYKYDGETYVLLFAAQDNLVCGSEQIEQLPVDLEAKCVTLDGELLSR
jgi:hypothetical protein